MGKRQRGTSIGEKFEAFSKAITQATGSTAAFGFALAVIIGWAIVGPMFGFSDTWQLVINTGTTIVTFLMVFLIQNTQNRDGAAIQAKLDELIRAHHDARNMYMGIEKLPEEELTELREHCADTAGGASDANSNAS